MLEKWLTTSERNPNPFPNFHLNDIIANSSIDQPTKKHLIEIYQDNMIDPTLYGQLADKLGWHKAKEYFLDTKIPTIKNLQKGHFGEILNGSILEELYNYVIPIRKLQYSFTQNKPLPSTDLIALRIEDNQITEVCFSESKLRITYDSGVAVEGYKQLVKDQGKKMPNMLWFIMSRLYEAKDQLFTPFLNYLCDRTDGSISMEILRLGIVNDSNNWQENPLQSLNEEIGEVSTTVVDLVLINDLDKLLREFYQSIGVNYSDE